MRSLSATQIDTFAGEAGCPRKWVFRYIFDLVMPKTEALELGEKLHAQKEASLRGNPPLDMHPSVKASNEDAGHPPFPTAQELMRREVLIEEPSNHVLGISAAGLPIKGRLDFVDLRTDEARIIDWKTLSRPEYQKTAQALENNVQAIVYARWLFTTYPARKHVVVTHGYLFTGNNVGCEWTSTGRIEPSKNEEIWEEQIVPIAARMKAYFEHPPEDWKEVEACSLACGSYGGCPYQGICVGAIDCKRYRDLVKQGATSKELATIGRKGYDYMDTNLEKKGFLGGDDGPSLKDLLSRGNDTPKITQALTEAPCPYGIAPPDAPDDLKAPTLIERVDALEEEVKALKARLTPPEPKKVAKGKKHG